MGNEIIISLIGFAGVCCGGLFGYLGRTKKQAVIDAKREQEQADNMNMILDEMREIKKRLDQHNHYAEKIGDIDKSIISIKKDIEYLRKEGHEKTS